jgi:adenine phosphoribosyltransferase
MSMNIESVRTFIRDVPDYPKPGILFKDITPLLGDAKAFKAVIDLMTAKIIAARPHKLIGIESRGFIFAAALAERLQLGFVPVRKKGKLPHKIIYQTFQLEYGEDQVEMHEDALLPGERVLIIDDVLATGGTAEAAVSLSKKLEANVVGCHFVIELAFLKGREKLSHVSVETLLKY